MIDRLLAIVVESGASDLHVGVDRRPTLRVNGDLRELDQVEAGDVVAWLKDQISDDQWTTLMHKGDVDFSFDSINGSRFRGSAFLVNGEVNLALRLLPAAIPTMTELDLPRVVQEWTNRDSGLIIVTGPTGSGKSTTIASMVNSLNQSQQKHILTIEDPVEYLLPPGKCVVNQREIGPDSQDFPRAIRAGLREDVDIMVVGEMRDRETMAAAITVAETGHLVFATLHTSGAASAVDRIIDVFEPSQQPLIRARLANSLIGVVYQRLLKSADGGRVAAFEVLVADYATKNLIREGKTFQIPNSMVTGATEGMALMDRSIADLAASGKISKEVAEQFLKQNS